MKLAAVRSSTCSDPRLVCGEVERRFGHRTTHIQEFPVMTKQESTTTRVGRRTALRTGVAAGSVALLGAVSRSASSPIGAAARAGADPVEPAAGHWRPWALTSGSQFRPAAPPDTETTMAELTEVRALADRRDAATLDRIRYWDTGAPGYRWTEM